MTASVNLNLFRDGPEDPRRNCYRWCCVVLKNHETIVILAQHHQRFRHCYVVLSDHENSLCWHMAYKLKKQFILQELKICF